MKSMTGYGWGECAQDGLKVSVELSSVNRKQAEISINLPRELEMLETQMREEIQRQIARGRVTARVNLHFAEGKEAARIHIDHGLAKAYAAEFRRLARELGISEALSLDVLARAPGVMQTNDELGDAESSWPKVQKALAQALGALVKMREREGLHLRKDLSAHIATMRKAAARVQKLAPNAQKRYRTQLLERLKAAGLERIGEDEDRLLKEVVLFADRSDISEELTRLQSHFQQYDDCLQKTEPIGRTLDFLAQEMNREINTIGAKANDAAISREVVLLKTELEKFREQAQNVE
jgi:uncharacterized protein (TIGR00255 family)